MARKRHRVEWPVAVTAKQPHSHDRGLAAKNFRKQIPADRRQLRPWQEGELIAGKEWQVGSWFDRTRLSRHFFDTVFRTPFPFLTVLLMDREGDYARAFCLVSLGCLRGTRSTTTSSAADTESHRGHQNQPQRSSQPDASRRQFPP